MTFHVPKAGVFRVLEREYGGGFVHDDIFGFAVDVGGQGDEDLGAQLNPIREAIQQVVEAELGRVVHGQDPSWRKATRHQ